MLPTNIVVKSRWPVLAHGYRQLGVWHLIDVMSRQPSDISNKVSAFRRESEGQVDNSTGPLKANLQHRERRSEADRRSYRISLYIEFVDRVSAM